MTQKMMKPIRLTQQVKQFRVIGVDESNHPIWNTDAEFASILLAKEYADKLLRLRLAASAQLGDGNDVWVPVLIGHVITQWVKVHHPTT